jgi:Zn ribbon nucleic-acid-binding protein
MANIMCPKCEEQIAEKVWDEVREWGVDALRCSYCGCPLDRRVLQEKRWQDLMDFKHAESHSSRFTRGVRTGASTLKNLFWG